MSIAIGDVYALMAHAIGDCQRAETHIDQQRDVAVTQIVYAYRLEPAYAAAPAHLVVQVVLREGEEPVVWLMIVIKRDDVVVHLLHQEVRHGDDPLRLRGLGRGYHVLSLDALVALGDVHQLLLEVDVLLGESQQLANSQPAPVQHLEGVVALRLVHDGFAEQQVLLPGPKLHLRPLPVADGYGGLDRALPQAVMPHGVVKYGACLVVERPQVRLAERLAGVVVGSEHLILPVDHVLAGDVVHAHLAEERDQLRLDDVLLGEPGVLLEPGAHVLFVALDKRLERHRHGAVHGCQEVRLPYRRRCLGDETALGLVAVLAILVVVVALHDPALAVIALVDGHLLRPDSAVAGHSEVVALEEVAAAHLPL